MARPSFFTVEEAARVLRIGRTAAYQAAKQYRETGGTAGLKVIQVGGSLRVPRAWLEEVADGPFDLGDPAQPGESPDGQEPPRTPAHRAAPGDSAVPTQSHPSRRPSRRHTRTADQPTLPFVT